MKNTKLIGGLMLVGAGVVGYMALKKMSPFGFVTANQVTGRIAQGQERDRARARSFLTQITGKGNDLYAQEVVMQSSGLASGKAMDFQKVLHRQSLEGRASFANYNDLGVAQ